MGRKEDRQKGKKARRGRKPEGRERKDYKKLFDEEEVPILHS